jgi:hypothetical protein
LGRLQIVSGENLYATRFDGARLYVVTFRQIDPLWIIDLSDPANPSIQGELQVPGWSTYLHPMGDRLLAMGQERWLPTVSCLTWPGRTRRVCSAESPWSTVRVRPTRPKAFKVLADEGLVLVPVSGSRGTNRVQGIQLVEFDRATLTLRGLIDHRMNPLRATAVDHRLVSISASELLTVDATDRDQPVVRGRLSLQDVVDRVWAVGTHLLQLERASTSGGTNSELRVTGQATPRTALTRMPIDGMPLLGESLRQGRLHLIQGVGQTTTTPPTSTVAITTSARLRLTVIDTTRLPELSVLAQTTIEPTNYWGESLTALWPNDHTLVWTSSGSSWFGWLTPRVRNGEPANPFAGGKSLIAASSLKSAKSWHLFFPVGQFGGATILRLRSGVTGTPVCFRGDITSDQRRDVRIKIRFRGQSVSRSRHAHADPDFDAAPPTNTALLPMIPWPGRFQYLHQYEVVVLDYRHPNQPMVRSAVALPGQLSAIARDGTLVFATGPHAADTDDVRPYLHALAYDGFAASLIDSLPQSNASTVSPLISETGSVLVGERGSAGRPPRLVRWELEQDAKFHRRATVALHQPAGQLYRFNDLLAVITTADIELRDATDTLKFRLLNRETPDCTWWLNMQSADGAKAAGLWLPQGSQGLQHVSSERSQRGVVRAQRLAR